MVMAVANPYEHQPPSLLMVVQIGLLMVAYLMLMVLSAV